MPGIVYSLGLNNSSLLSGLAVAGQAVRGFIGSIGAISAITGGLVGVSGAVLGIKKSLEQASGAENLQLIMARLLKDGNEAKRMVADLTKFADVTPFEPGPVQEAGKQLLAFGFNAKDVIPILTDVGDLAAGMGKDLGEVADAMGRLKAGQFGEAFEAFRRFGISLEALQAKGLKFDGGGSFQGSAQQAMDAIREIIRERFGGAMDDLSRSSAGLFSTLKGNFDALFREFGGPLNEAIKPALEAGVQWLADMTPAARQLGESFADALRTARELFSQGQMGSLLSVSLRLGFAEGVNFGAGLLKGVVQGTGSALGAAIQVAVEPMRLITQPNFWTGLGSSLLAAAQGFNALMMQGTAEVMRGLARVPGLGVLGRGADAVEAGARNAAKEAGQFKEAAASDLAPFAANFGAILKARMGEAFAGIKESINGTSIIDTAGLQQQITDALGGAAAKAKADDLFDNWFKRAYAKSPFEESTSAATNAATPFNKGEIVADKLSKVGLFIGGAGGPRAQKAAEETARNTGKLIEGNAALLKAVQDQKLGTFIA